ncbi:MAG: bifunctional diaminohydroxyphosphoribosylaminopyrimidine deaminase/5-amino-6-(5-phosphoribosylamino)uracil reductase RibD [Cellvibrionaceae bacterium]
MAKAIQLAERGLYTTRPNPRVGCVLTQNDQVIAEGWHVRAGEGHAEVNALASARGSAQSIQGATCYVTLEPCSHTGKTGPCCDALIEAGVSRVVYGLEDPNPEVAGRGLEKLRAAGVEVVGPLLENQCRELNPGFIRRMEGERPFVRCKSAMSVDGRTAMASGESKWITGANARADVQRLRARSCAVITGVGTVIHDNPSLNVRADETGLPTADAQAAAASQPLRVVVDSQLKTPPESMLFKVGSAEGAPVLVVCTHRDEARAQVLEGMGVEVIELPGKHGHLTGPNKVDLVALLDELAQRGCNEILVEAGAGLSGAFLRLGLVDELWIYMAQVLMGSSARPLFELPVDTMSCKLLLSWKDMRKVGDDLRIIAIPDYEG